MNTKRTRAEAQSEGQGSGLPDKPEPTPGLLAKSCAQVFTWWQSGKQNITVSLVWVLPGRFLILI